MDVKLAEIFRLDLDYSSENLNIIFKQLCCLRDHYQFIINHLKSQLNSTHDHVSIVEYKKILEILHCTLLLIEDFNVAIKTDMRTRRTGSRKYIMETACCLYDYLTNQEHLAILDKSGDPISFSDDKTEYTNICHYGVKLHNCFCVKEIRFLIQC